MAYELKKIPLNRLVYDPRNPRLPNYVGRDQSEMFEYLAKSSSIDELVSAIAENDFFEGEALIAVPAGRKFEVVEGNRRLTALKLLDGERFEGMSSRLQELCRDAKHRPSLIPVAVYGDRREVLSYLGNRHIAGVKPWGALAKARYIKEIFLDTDESESFLQRCRTVAKIIGSRRDFIARSMKAIDVYNVAEERDFFELDDVDEETIKFSFLSTAIDYEGVQDFLYPDRDPDNPLDESDVDVARLEELFIWLFVRDPRTGKPKIGESRNLNKLSRIMLNAKALAAFRDGASIDQAYIQTTGVDEDFDATCFELQRGLREANSLVADVSVTDHRVDLVASIFKQARQLSKSFD